MGALVLRRLGAPQMALKLGGPLHEAPAGKGRLARVTSVALLDVRRRRPAYRIVHTR